MKISHLARALALAAIVVVGLGGMAQARDLRININANNFESQRRHTGRVGGTQISSAYYGNFKLHLPDTSAR